MKTTILLVVFCLIFGGRAVSQDIGFYGIGGGVGFVNVSHGVGSSSSGFGLNARANLGEITTNLRLVPEISYWSVSENFGMFGDSFKWTWSDIAINANVHYFFNLEGSFEPYVGGGLGLNIISLNYTDSFMGETWSASSSTTEIGFNLIGGASLDLGGALSPFGEFRYVVVSGINHLMIKAGIMYGL